MLQGWITDFGQFSIFGTARWCLGQLYERRKGEKGNKAGANQHTNGSELRPQNEDKPKGRVADQVAVETGTSKATVERSAAFTRTVEALALLEHTLKLSA